MHNAPPHIGMLIYPQMDRIDFTGPFEVFSRIEGATVLVMAQCKEPVRDALGLILTPEYTLGDAPALDVLHVPGGPAAGRSPLMEDEKLLAFISDHANSGKLLYSVCTGALLCGAAGILIGKRATTHWAAMDLLPYFGAIPVNERVVRDGNIVTAAGVTAGLDGAFTVVAALRGDQAAERIQLGIQYAPHPPFHAGSPETAPRDVLQAVEAQYRPLKEARLAEARRVAKRLGIDAS